MLPRYPPPPLGAEVVYWWWPLDWLAGIMPEGVGRWSIVTVPVCCWYVWINAAIILPDREPKTNVLEAAIPPLNYTGCRYKGSEILVFIKNNRRQRFHDEFGVENAITLSNISYCSHVFVDGIAHSKRNRTTAKEKKMEGGHIKMWSNLSLFFVFFSDLKSWERANSK